MINFVKKYFVTLVIVLLVSISIGFSYSSFFITSNGNRATEMYVGKLKYDIYINSESTNKYSVFWGETSVQIKIVSSNEIDTYYKLVYSNNPNVNIKYDSLGNSPSGIIKSGETIIVNCIINNSSLTNQELIFDVFGGYIHNGIDGVIINNNYSEIVDEVKK